MLFLALVVWWYTEGWLGLSRRLLRRLFEALDFFSIGLLLKSLFAPFRQISAGQVRGSIEIKLRAWADRLISRAIGAMVRLAVILFGMAAIIALVAISIILLLAWPLLPIIPIIVLVVTLGARR